MGKIARICDFACICIYIFRQMPVFLLKNYEKLDVMFEKLDIIYENQFFHQHLCRNLWIHYFSNFCVRPLTTENSHTAATKI